MSQWNARLPVLVKIGSRGMRNLIILGSGRSGTSMVAALFRNTSAYFGDALIKANVANPYGYYEDESVNRINDLLILRQLRSRLMRHLPAWCTAPAHRDRRALWLAAPRRFTRTKVPAELAEEIKKIVGHVPFCLKDPRFNITLDAWRPFLPPNTRFIVVFRNPQRTVDSILRNAVERYVPPLQISRRWAFLQWYRGYRRVLRAAANSSDWLFVGYDDVLGGRAVSAIERFAEATVDTSELNPDVSRSKSGSSGPDSLEQRCDRLYQQFVLRSEKDLKNWSP